MFNITFCMEMPSLSWSSSLFILFSSFLTSALGKVPLASSSSTPAAFPPPPAPIAIRLSVTLLKQNKYVI